MTDTPSNGARNLWVDNVAATGLVVSGKFFFFSSRRRHTIFKCDWSSDVCSSDLSLVVVTTPVWACVPPLEMVTSTWLAPPPGIAVAGPVADMDRSVAPPPPPGSELPLPPHAANAKAAIAENQVQRWIFMPSRLFVTTPPARLSEKKLAVRPMLRRDDR